MKTYTPIRKMTNIRNIVHNSQHENMGNSYTMVSKVSNDSKLSHNGNKVFQLPEVSAHIKSVQDLKTELFLNNLSLKKAMAGNRVNCSRFELIAHYSKIGAYLKNQIAIIENRLHN